MEITSYRPKSLILQEYIDSYYILQHSVSDAKVSYLTFPSVFSIVAVVNNAQNSIGKEKILIKSSHQEQLDTSLVCRFNKPICFEYQGDIKEICIYFKPLGLNAFLKADLDHYSKSLFDPFLPFPDYFQVMKNILEIDNNDLIAQRVEEYWLSKRIGFNHTYLNEIVALIEGDIKLTTAELAQKAGVSQKSLIAQFKKHLCKTPSEYKKILRFRRALNEMKNTDEKISLTELTHLIDFFDQSHMIANFKSLTGYSPRKFFTDLTTLRESQIHWIFQ
jgi:AraC-like DNA-binding protein